MNSEMRSAILLALFVFVGVCAYTLHRDQSELEEEHFIRVVRSTDSKEADSNSSEEKDEKKEKMEKTESKNKKSGEEEDDSDEDDDSVMEKIIPSGNMIHEGSGDIEASGERVSRDESSGFSGFGDFEGSGSGDRNARDTEGSGEASSGEDLFSEVVRVVREGEGSGDD